MLIDNRKKQGLSTLAIHAGEETHEFGPLTIPIYQTSTFIFGSAEEGIRRFAGVEEGYVYSRLGNPTVRVLERKVAALEGAEEGLAFATGMAAISAVLLGLVKTGDHILATRGLYGCTYGLLNMMKTRFGVDYALCSMQDEQMLEAAIRPNTRILYIETPSNPTMELTDLALAARVANQHGIVTVVDNTFMSPCLQRPIEHGCDIVVHSATKYIGGHGDVVAGIAVGPKEVMDGIRMTTQKDIGGTLSPFDAYLLIRGVKTLGIRMERHSVNAMGVARFLKNHPAVAQVYYPGLPDFPQHELGRRQMDGFGGCLSFELKGGYEAGIRLLNRVRLCKRAVSLGDVDTLIQHPASMTHSVVPPEIRAQMGISDGLIRLSVGIEDIEDILDDLVQALSEN